MKKTMNDFCEYLISRVGSLYVLGAQGESLKGLAKQFIAEKEKRFSSRPGKQIPRVLAQLDKALPKDIYFYDCSGLGVAWLLEQGLIDRDYTANAMFTQLCSKITKADLRKGDWVFLRNVSTGNISHIGYLVDEDLNVVESKGRDDGVVMRPLSAGNWNVFGRPHIFPKEVQNKTAIIGRVLRLSSPYMRGEDVRALQESIKALGISIEIDGIFGRGTETALVAAQKRLFPGNPSEWDGQAGERTVTALGLIWEV